MHTHIDYSTLHYITVHYIALYCITLHHIASHCVTSHYIALHCIAYCNIRTVITLHYGTLQYITLHIYHTYVYTHIYIYNNIYIYYTYLSAVLDLFFGAQPLHLRELHSCCRRENCGLVRRWCIICYSTAQRLSWGAVFSHMICPDSRAHTLALSTGDSMRSCLRQSVKTAILPKCGGIKENYAMTWIGRSQNKKLFECEG